MKILLKIVSPFFCSDSLVLELFQVWPQKGLKHICIQNEKKVNDCVWKKQLPYIRRLTMSVMASYIPSLFLRLHLPSRSTHILDFMFISSVTTSVFKSRLWSEALVSHQALLGSSPSRLRSRSLFHKAHWRMYHQGLCLSGPPPTESLGSHLETAWAAVKTFHFILLKFAIQCKEWY